MDHDAKLNVAMHVMSEEVARDEDKEPGALARQFFPQSKIDSGEHALLIPIIKGMWSLGVNGLQLNQGENSPAQLTELVSQAKKATPAEFETLQGMLKALSIHEITDLMGAANPFMSVLPGAVVGKAWNSLETLGKKLPDARASDKPAADAAKDLYEALHPKLSEANAAALQKVLPGDDRVKVLGTRIGSMCRLNVAGEKDGKLVVDALHQLKQADPKGMEALLQSYGNQDNPVFMYYGPTLVDNVKDKLLGKASFEKPEDLSIALRVLAQAAGKAAQVVDQHGGPEKFQKTSGADFVNLRDACHALSNDKTITGDTLRAGNVTLPFEAKGNMLGLHAA